MKPFPFFLSSLVAPLSLALSGCQPSSSGVPVQEGETYWITFPKDTVENVSTGNGFMGQHTTAKVLRLVGGPWVEVETYWTPQVQIDSSGKSVPPTTKTSRFLLNLDHALIIRKSSAGQ